MLRNTLLVIFCFLFSVAVSQVKNCKKCGIYLDSVKVDKVECSSFSVMEVVLPYSKKIDSAALLNVWVGYNEIGKFGRRDSCVFFLPKPVLKIVNQKYIVITVFDKADEKSAMTLDFHGDRAESVRCPLTYSMFVETLKESKNKVLSFRIEKVDIVKKGKGNYKTSDAMDFNLTPLTDIYTFKCSHNPDTNCKVKGVGMKIRDL